MLVYDRNPESVRTVSMVFAAGRVGFAASSAEDPRIDSFLRGEFADAPPKRPPNRFTYRLSGVSTSLKNATSEW